MRGWQDCSEGVNSLARLGSIPDLTVIYKINECILAVFRRQGVGCINGCTVCRMGQQAVDQPSVSIS